MTKKERDTTEKKQQAQEAGYDARPWRGLRIHSQNTLVHEFCKFALCYALSLKGREWDSEVECGTGRVDVFDFGPVDGRPVVYEIETDVTPARREQKVNQYTIGPVRDVIVVDPDDVPETIEEAVAYFSTHVVIG